MFSSHKIFMMNGLINQNTSMNEYPLAITNTIFNYSNVLNLFLGTCNDYDIRLFGSSDLRQGLVEVCIGNTWRRWCGPTFSNGAAAVTCRQLGYLNYGKSIFFRIRHCPNLVNIRI